MWSLLRALVFGVAAAAVGALAYSTFVSVTGWELGILAAVLGLLVGWAVSAGGPSVPTGWVRAISVLLTLFSLMLSEYLLLWRVYDEAGDSVPIPVGEAGPIIWDQIYRNPEVLLIWGFALLAALGFARDSESDDAGSADVVGVVGRGDGVGPSRHLVHVVELRQHPLRAADFDLFAVLPAPLEGVTLRRVSGVLSDLPGALPHLFDLDPDVVAASGGPVYPRRVEDRAFATLDVAKDAAQALVAETDPEEWLDGDAFRSTIQNDPGFRQSLRPGEQRVGTLGRVTIGIASVAVFAAIMYGGGRLKVLTGLETPEREGTLPYAAFDVINFLIAAGLAIVTGISLARILARRHLARAAAAPSSPADVGDADSLQDPPPVPDRLVVQPRSRLWWCAGWIAAALLCFVIGVEIATGPNPEPAGLPIMTALAMVCCLAGLLGLRWALVADRDGLVLSKALTTRRIRWADLEGIELVLLQAEVTLGFHQLVFMTRGGQRRSTPFTGFVKPGAPLPQLRKSLIAMRDKHLSALPSPFQSATRTAGAPTQSPTPMDRASATAFALSLVGAAVVAAPLAIWGLLRTGPAARRRGGGLAVAALGISATWMVVASTLLVGTGLVGGAVASTESAGATVATTTEPQQTVSPLADPDPVATPAVSPREVLWADLRPAMCVAFPTSGGPDVTVVDCQVEHEEVMGRTTLAGPSTWPGWEAVDEAARAACRPVFKDYMGETYDDTRWWIDYLTVDEAEWADGKRTVVCLVWDPSE